MTASARNFTKPTSFPFLKEYGWTITNAWISAKDTPDYLWKENEEVVKAGWVDRPGARRGAQYPDWRIFHR